MAPIASQSRGYLLLTALMDAALVLAILLVIRLAIGFFAVTMVHPAGRWFLAITHPLALPVVGDRAVRTPYGGVFGVDTGIVIIGLLFIEWAFALVRKRLFADTKGSA